MLKFKTRSCFSAVFSIVLLSKCLNPFYAHSGELRELYEGARQMGMGGAGLALADDESMIFWNQAGLAGVDGIDVHFAIVDMQLSDEIITAVLGGLSNLSGLSALNNLMGYNVYGRAQVTPSFTAKHLGFALYADGQTNLYIQNQAMPKIILGYQTTTGFQGGIGFSLMPRARRSKTKNDFRVGIGAKYMFRRGGYHQIPIADLPNLSRTTLTDVTGGWGTGYGGDLAFQYLYYYKPQLTFSLGAVYNEIGGLAFDGGGDYQPGALNFGLGVVYKQPIFRVSFAYDYRRALDDTDWRKKNHLGLELKLPIFSFLGGINGVYFSYGAGIDIWLLKITAVSYSKEIGSFVNIDQDHRYMLRADIKLSL